MLETSGWVSVSLLVYPFIRRAVPVHVFSLCPWGSVSSNLQMISKGRDIWEEVVLLRWHKYTALSHVLDVSAGQLFITSTMRRMLLWNNSGYYSSSSSSSNSTPSISIREIENILIEWCFKYQKFNNVDITRAIDPAKISQGYATADLLVLKHVVWGCIPFRTKSDDLFHG